MFLFFIATDTQDGGNPYTRRGSVRNTNLLDEMAAQLSYSVCSVQESVKKG